MKIKVHMNYIRIHVCKNSMNAITMYGEFDIIYYPAGDVSLGMILTFFSGADDITPMGYVHAPEINFNHSSPYPTSSTCALQLTLPTCYSEYGPFKHALDTAFTMHGGFGLS